jgi:hypothetical protein
MDIARTHARPRMHALTHARTHARTRTHAHTQACARTNPCGRRRTSPNACPMASPRPLPSAGLSPRRPLHAAAFAIDRSGWNGCAKIEERPMGSVSKRRSPHAPERSKRRQPSPAQADAQRSQRDIHSVSTQSSHTLPPRHERGTAAII